MNNLEDKIKKLTSRVDELENKVEKIFKENSSDYSVKNELADKSKPLSLKEFIKSKKPDNYVDKVLVVGYYLERHKDLDSFNVNDLESSFRRAKEKLPPNMNDKVNLAIKKGMVMEAEEKKDRRKAWVLTSTGEEYVAKLNSDV